jgi:DUF4097 and DUF4098 domain-containing protein YvlB
MESMFLTTIALAALLSGTPVPGQAQPQPQPRPPQTDQSVPVARGTRLSIENFAGDVVIHGWDRDSLRVQARHSQRTRVSIKTNPSGVVVVSAGSNGPPTSVDYEINAPAWMPVKIDGMYTFISVDGMQSEISAETVRGDVALKGGNGFVSAKSIEGEIAIEGVRGRVSANSTNQGITITSASGDITAETINGAITLSKVESTHVEASTVNGPITYEGSAASGGRYNFSSHNGNIVVAVPETASATFTVRAYNGSVNSNLPLQGGGDVRRGRRVTYTLGSGAAEFEIESFGGTIHLRRPGTVISPKGKDKGSEKEKD